MGTQSANRREIPKTTTTTTSITTKTIAELAIATPALSTLLAAVKAAGLVETYLERDLSLSLLLLMMLSPRYLKMLSTVFLQTRMLSQLSSSAMLFPELLSRLKMFLMAPLLSRQQEERRSRSPGTDTSTSSHLQERPGSSPLTSSPPMVSSTLSILCFKDTSLLFSSVIFKIYK